MHRHLLSPQNLILHAAPGTLHWSFMCSAPESYKTPSLTGRGNWERRGLGLTRHLFLTSNHLLERRQTLPVKSHCIIPSINTESVTVFSITKLRLHDKSYNELPWQHHCSCPFQSDLLFIQPRSPGVTFISVLFKGKKQINTFAGCQEWERLPVSPARRVFNTCQIWIWKKPSRRPVSCGTYFVWLVPQ